MWTELSLFRICRLANCFEVSRAVSSVSIVHGRGTRSFLCLVGGLEPTWRWRTIPWNSTGVLTLYPRRVPICTPHVRYYLNLPNTKDGNLWIYAVVHMPELATHAVHPPRALAERYRFGIPIALLTSQLATGNCTKEKVRNFELG